MKHLLFQTDIHAIEQWLRIDMFSRTSEFKHIKNILKIMKQTPAQLLKDTFFFCLLPCHQNPPPDTLTLSEGRMVCGSAEQIHSLAKITVLNKHVLV